MLVKPFVSRVRRPSEKGGLWKNLKIICGRGAILGRTECERNEICPCGIIGIFDPEKWPFSAVFRPFSDFGEFRSEWGSRGREFDSRHSDQKPLIERSVAFLLYQAGLQSLQQRLLDCFYPFSSKQMNSVLNEIMNLYWFDLSLFQFHTIRNMFRRPLVI